MEEGRLRISNKFWSSWHFFVVTCVEYSKFLELLCYNSVYLSSYIDGFFVDGDGLDTCP